MTHDIEAGFDTIVDQASRTTRMHMGDAVRDIDKLFGEGYAAKHPELVCAYLQSASADFNHAMLKLAAQDIRDGLRAMAEAFSDR